MCSCKSISRSFSAIQLSALSCWRERSPNWATRATTYTHACGRSTAIACFTTSDKATAEILCAQVRQLNFALTIGTLFLRLAHARYRHSGGQRSYQLRFPAQFRDVPASHWSFGTLWSPRRCCQSHHLRRPLHAAEDREGAADGDQAHSKGSCSARNAIYSMRIFSSSSTRNCTWPMRSKSNNNRYFDDYNMYIRHDALQQTHHIHLISVSSLHF